MKTLIEEFAAYLQTEQRVSKTTVTSYCRDIALFCERLGLSEEGCFEAGAEDLQSYIAGLTSAGKSGSTVLRTASSLRGFYAFLHAKGRVENNPAEELKLPKRGRKAPLILSQEEIELVLSLPKQDEPKGLRDKAMLELLYATGIKVSELISLELKDVDLKGGSIVCRGSERHRMIPMGTAAEKAVGEYLHSARAKMVEGPKVKTLFVSCRGTPMTRQGFWKLIKSYIAEAGIKKDVTPQTLRHSFAVHLLQNGANLEDVTEMLGYNDRGSGRIYTGVVADRLKKTYKKAHPRA